MTNSPSHSRFQDHDQSLTPNKGLSDSDLLLVVKERLVGQFQ